MFEIGIFCVIFLAVSYWAVLWLMGRRQDVLRGEFVESEPHADEPVRPVFPNARLDRRRANLPLKRFRSNRRSGRNGWSRC